MSVYRRRWGAEFALQGARMRIARAYLVAGQAEPARRATRAAAGSTLAMRRPSRPPLRHPFRASRRARAGSPRAAAELLRPPARRAHDFGRPPPARTDGTTLVLVSRCLRVGGVPCECVVGRGRRGVCVCACPAPVTPPRRLLAKYFARAELRARTRCGLTKRGTRTATGYSSLDARAAALSALGTPACELQHVQRFSLPAASHSQHGASSLCGCMLWRLRSLLVAAARPKDRAVRARSLAHDERVLR